MLEACGKRRDPATTMRYIDLAVVAIYLAGITWFGAHFRSGQKSLRDYFLGGRTAPWWAISLSIVSAETSTLTIVGTPALAFPATWGSCRWCWATCWPAS